MSLRILQVVTLSERGGAQHHVLDVAGALVRRGHDVHLACAPGGPLVEDARGAGVQVHEHPHLVRQINPLNDVRELVALRSLIRRLRPDVVHSHSSKAGVLARCASRMQRVPSIYTAHGLVFLEPLGRARRRLYLTMERIGGRLGNAIIAVSGADAEAARGYRIARYERITVIPNGFDPPGPPAPFPQNPPFRFVVVANAYPTKGLDVLIAALRRPPLNELQVEIVVAGDGPDRARLEAAADGLPIEFVGRTDDVRPLLDRAHAVIQPSLKEGWPYSVLEAMGAGRAVIASAVGGMPDQLDGEMCGWLVPVGDPDGLAATMARVVKDPQAATERGAAGYERVRTKFPIERMVDLIEQEYRRVLRD